MSIIKHFFVDSIKSEFEHMEKVEFKLICIAKDIWNISNIHYLRLERMFPYTYSLTDISSSEK